MKIISRKEWGARPPRRVMKLPKTPTPEVWLHHAAGAILPGDDMPSASDFQRIRSIQRYHMDVRKWPDIAYTFLMDPDGNVFEGVGPYNIGTHTGGHNSHSQAICIMGNYDVQPVDEDLIPKIVEFFLFGLRSEWWNTPAGFTGGHRDAPGANTQCPGKNLYPRIPEINRKIREQYLMGWQKPGDYVGTKDDQKKVHEYQGNTILTSADIDYNETDPALVDDRWMISLTRLLDQVMHYQELHRIGH